MKRNLRTGHATMKGVFDMAPHDPCDLFSGAKAARFVAYAKDVMKRHNFNIDGVRVEYFPEGHGIRGQAKDFSRIILLDPNINPNSKLGQNTILHEHAHLWVDSRLRDEVQRSEYGPRLFELANSFLDRYLSGEVDLTGLNPEVRNRQLMDIHERGSTVDGTFTAFHVDPELDKKYIQRMSNQMRRMPGRFRLDYLQETRRSPNGPIASMNKADYIKEQMEALTMSWVVGGDDLMHYISTPSRLEEGVVTYLACEMQGVSLDEAKEFHGTGCPEWYFTSAKSIRDSFSTVEEVIATIERGKQEWGPLKYIKERVSIE